MTLMYDTVMILYVICQLVCVIDSWAHMSFGAFNFILKIGCDKLRQLFSLLPIGIPLGQQGIMIGQVPLGLFHLQGLIFENRQR